MFILLIAIGLNFYLYIIVPKGFFPSEDTGDLNGSLRGDQSVSFQLLEKKFADFVSIIARDPAVQNVVGFAGGGSGGGARGGGTNSGNVFVQLKPKAQRGGHVSTDQVVERLLKGPLGHISGARASLFNAGGVPGAGGRQGTGSYQYTLQADSLDELNEWVSKITSALQDVPELDNVQSDREDKGLEIDLKIDRNTASRLGISASQVDNTLYDAFGQRQVSTIYNDLNQYHVVMGVAPEFWQSPETLKDIYVSTAGGAVSGSAASGAVAGTTTLGDTAASDVAADALRNQQLNALTNSARGNVSTGASVSTRVETMVPLSAFSSFGPGTTPLSINHQGPFVATTFSFNLPVGVSLGQATAAIERTMAAIHVPASIHGGFAGSARLFQDSVSGEPLLILAAILAVYIVLGILYESYVHPLTILSTLPSAGVGAVLALLVAGKLFAPTIQFDLFALIGVILLIGIVKKNAIMMIDFALVAEREEGLTSREAIYRACLLRFRPIMMTTFAAILGALPLAIGFGTGSELRQPLGISIVGGLAVSQVLTLYTTPVVYLYLDRFRARAKRGWDAWYGRLVGDTAAP